jgi:hypothetical protein
MQIMKFLNKVGLFLEFINGKDQLNTTFAVTFTD